ncbi:MAG: hypothetical protein AAF242_15050, partial [Bacteroidota bacterium]
VPALDYIWNYFQQTLLSGATQTICNTIEKLKKALAHRPFEPTSAAHQRFLQKTLTEIGNFEQKHPGISFEEEKMFLRNSII